eukprot:8597749-Ditylum_brightwellii.AAC.1
MMQSISLYLVVTCSLHNLQTYLCNKCEFCLGDGGQNEDEVSNNDKKIKKLQEPVLTQWWYVASCAITFKESMAQWCLICTTLKNFALSHKASYKFSSYTLSLMNNQAIMNNLELLVSYHKTFMDPPFTFLQLGNARTCNIPAFQSRHIAIHYFLKVTDLEALVENKW